MKKIGFKIVFWCLLIYMKEYILKDKQVIFERWDYFLIFFLGCLNRGEKFVWSIYLIYK